MKNVLLVLAVVVLSGIALSSCNSAKSCPAYGKVTKPSTERSV